MIGVCSGQGSNLGFDHSLGGVKDAHEDGFISEVAFAEVLRAYQAAGDATSQQRDEAEARKNSSRGRKYDLGNLVIVLPSWGKMWQEVIRNE